MSPASVNRHLALLKHLLTLAIEWGKATENPVKSLRLFKENNARVRYLTADEEVRLFQVCPDRYKPLLTEARYRVKSLLVSQYTTLYSLENHSHSRVKMRPLARSFPEPPRRGERGAWLGDVRVSEACGDEARADC